MFSSEFCENPHCKGFHKIWSVKQNLWGDNPKMNIIYDGGVSECCQLSSNTIRHLWKPFHTKGNKQILIVEN